MDSIRDHLLARLNEMVPGDIREIAIRLYNSNDVDNCLLALKHLASIEEFVLADDFRLRAACHAWKENSKLAAEDYSRAIEILLLEPEEEDDDDEEKSQKKLLLASVYEHRGDSYTRMDTRDDDIGYVLAREDYSKALEIRQDSFYLYVSRASMHSRLGDYDLALKDFDAALAVNPDSADAISGRALLHVRMGRKDLAMKDFGTAFSMPDGPSNKYVVADRSIARLCWEDYEGAVEDYTAMVGICREESDMQSAATSLWRRGFALCHLGEFDAAMKDIEESYEMDPLFPTFLTTQRIVSNLLSDFESFVPLLRPCPAIRFLRTLIPKLDSMAQRLSFVSALIAGNSDGPISCARSCLLLRGLEFVCVRCLLIGI